MPNAPLRVAIQGEKGAFSHQAAIGLLGPDVEIVATPSFDALFALGIEDAATETVDHILVPVENSLTGSIHENYDRLRASPLHIVGETQLRIEQCLIARPGVSLQAVEKVSSHVVALAQCVRFFEEHPWMEAVVVYDTAGAVRELQRSGATNEAAIGSRLAAELYGCEVLAAEIEDDPQNFTRFLLLGREAGRSETASKVSLVFTLRNVAGILHQALGAFAARGVDLVKIESRPLRGRPWEYAFYLDAVGDPRGALGLAVEELRSLCGEFRVLGFYADGLHR